MQFNVNWIRLIAWLLPTELGKTKILRYIIVLIEPIRSNYIAFQEFRKQQLYDLQINGQVIKLERVLNDMFDNVQRRIYITDGATYQPPIFFEEYKNKSVIFFEELNVENPIFYDLSILDNIITFNFFVHVPSDVWLDKTRVRALVNKYKVFGRTFDILLIL